MKLDDFLNKIATFSATKGAELYSDYVLYVRLEAGSSLVISIIYLLLLVYAMRSMYKCDLSKIYAKIDTENKAVGAVVGGICLTVMLFIGLVGSVATIFDADSYLAIFNPEGYIISTAVTGCK